MGLDITAYSKVTPLDDDSDAYDVRLIDNTAFPGRAAPFKNGMYDCRDTLDVFHKSYGTYNEWRDWLAKIAGYHGARDMWVIKEPGQPIPFWEIINFSDCEGTIGTVACKKMLKDFEDYDQKARSAEESWLYDTYVDIHEGLKLAANGGCLKFS